jgi:hypothetical protein
VVPEFLNPVYMDPAWLLVVASRFLDGARLYTDVIETNPPLIIWLHVVPVALARALEASPVSVFRVTVVGVLLGSVALANTLLARVAPDDPGRRRALVLLVVFVLFPLARHDFGQREHIFLALLLPYLFLLACRAAGKPIESGRAVALGALAGLGMSIKPHFGLVWAALAGWQWLTLRARRPRSTPEMLAAGMVLLLYALVVLAATPEYVDFARRFARAYTQFASNGLIITALLGDGSWLVIGALMAYLALRPCVPARQFWDPVAIAAGAGFLSAVLQQKGWRYHFYPSLSLGVLLLGGLALDVRGRLASPARRLALLLAVAGLLTIVTTTGGSVAKRLADGLNWERSIGGRLILWTRAQPEDRLLMVNFGWAEAAVALQAGKTPTSRVALLLREKPANRMTTRLHRTPAEMGFVEHTLFRMTVEDFLRADPVLLMILEPSPEFDDLAYFAQDSTFDRLFRKYSYVATVEGRHVFRRLLPGETRVLRPVSLALPEPPQAPLLLSYRKRRAPVFLGFLAVLLYSDQRRRRRPADPAG